MNVDRLKSSSVFYCIAIPVIAIIYYWIAQMSFMFAWRHTNVNADCPSSAVGFIIIYIFGQRFWPGIWLGVFLVNAGYYFSNPSFNLFQVILFSIPIATGNTLEAVVSSYLLKKLIGNRNPLHKAQDILRFALMLMVGCAIGASMGAITVCLSNLSYWNSFVFIWFIWWFGNFSWIFTLTPFFWAIGQRPFSKVDLKRILEFVISLSVLGVSNEMVFNDRFIISQMHIPITYFPLALTVWLTYRFGYWGAITSILLTLNQAFQGTSKGAGPFFSSGDISTSLLLLDTFIATVCGTCLLLAAALYEHRQAQKKIFLSEQRFRALVENNSDIILLVNSLGVITYCSPSVTRIMGYRQEEQVGHNILEFIHSEYEESIKIEFSHILSHPAEVIKTLVRIRHKNGSWRWVEGSGQNLLRDTSIGAIVVNYRDITEKKQVQERFERVFESSPLAKIIVNKQGKIQLVNQTAEVLLGYPREEMLKMSIDDFVPERVRKPHPAHREGFHKSPKVRPMGSVANLSVLTKDKREIPVEIALTPIENEDGLLVLATIMDITERKAAEEVLRNELKQATRLADVGTLAAIVAHELRTPLGVIQMAAHNLKNKNKDLAKDKHLENIQKKVWEGNHIIDNLLSYSNIKMPIYESCPILNLLDECISNVSNQFQRLDIAVDKFYKVPQGFVLEIDSNQIREVIVNVLNNAYQSMDIKGGRIEVLVQRNNDEFLQISFKDSGVGIGTENLDKIFRPFFTTKAKGTGLGLTICNEIINLHHGRFDIQSLKAQGTTVSISLPIQSKIFKQQ
ncbi:MAG: PAS domain S-box protein [Candidatus Omnitrophota bacterium]